MSTASRSTSGLGIVPKLTLAFAVFAAALTLLAGLIAYSTARSALEEVTRSNLEISMVEKLNSINDWIQFRHASLIALVQSPYLISDLTLIQQLDENDQLDNGPTKRINALLSGRVGEGKPFLSLFVMDPDTGKVLVSSVEQEVGTFQGDQPFFIDGRKSPYLQTFYYSESLQNAAMTLSAPVIDEEGRLIGVLAGHLDLEELNQILNRSNAIHKTSDSYLVGRSNLFASQPRFITESVVLQREIYTPAVQDCLTGTSGVMLADDYRGIQVISAYQWMNNFDACLVVEIDQSEAFAPVQVLAKRMIQVGALALLVAILFAGVLARAIAQPVFELRMGVDRLTAGEAVSIPVTSNDELGALAIEFNRMAKAIEEKEAALTFRAEQLAEANRELEAFSYSVSHDLRAPLRAIEGFSKFLLEDYGPQLDEEAQRYIGIIRKGIVQMGQLIDDLLAFSRISRQSMKTEALLLDQIIEQAYAGLALQREGRKVEFSMEKLPPCNGDPIMLRQAMVNLVSNALKYSANREVSRIEIGSFKSDDNENIYFVRDNGVGFDMKYAGKLFGVFQRLHRPEEYEGTGVGLAIVQRVIRRHGGRIWAEAEVDKGATFYFTLPDVQTKIRDVSADEESSIIERARELI